MDDHNVISRAYLGFEFEDQEWFAGLWTGIKQCK